MPIHATPSEKPVQEGRCAHLLTGAGMRVIFLAGFCRNNCTDLQNILWLLRKQQAAREACQREHFRRDRRCGANCY